MVTRDRRAAFVLFMASIGLMAVFGQLGGVRLAHAASTFTVNRLDDPASPDDCTGGTGSLRACIAAALASSGNTVAFSVNGTITLTQGALSLSPSSAETITINGNGISNTVLDGNNTNRVLTVGGNATALVTNLTIQHGKVTNFSGGGAILNSGTLTLTGDLLASNNEVGQGGGAITNLSSGHLTITNSTLSQNSATGSRGPASGGAIFDEDIGEVAVTGSTFVGNHATGDTGFGGQGGAIGYKTGFDTVTVLNSTITGNQALGDGTNANAPSGGGVYSLAGQTDIKDSTVAGNSATRGANLFFDGNNTTAPPFSLQGNIVSGSPGNNCMTVNGGSFTDNGYNLDSDTPTTCGLSAGNHDVIGQDPALGPLQDNGGPTQTMAITNSSPAWNGGSPGCPPPATDQRGQPRSFSGDTVCDIGAFEVQAAVASPSPSPPKVLPKSGSAGVPADLRLLVVPLIVLLGGPAMAAGLAAVLRRRRRES
jgi:hypothetical protein